MSRPFAWERSYPTGMRWDAPIESSTIPKLLDDAATRFSDAVALEFRGRRLTYQEFAQQVDAVAAGFLACGFRRGDRVALYLPNTIHHPITFFAAAKAGLVLVQLSPLDADQELAYKLEDSDARLIVTTNFSGMAARAVRLLSAGLLDCVVVAEDEAWSRDGTIADPIPVGPGIKTLTEFIDHGVVSPSWPDIAPEDIALLQYTGGTTGKPKGAILSHANITSATAMYHTWSAGSEEFRPGRDRIICVLPLFHIYALTAILLRGLKRGAEILIRRRFDVEMILSDIEKGRATHFQGVPTMLIAITAWPGVEGRDFSSLIYIGSGGAPLPIKVADSFERLTGQRLSGGWGMTETSPAGTNRPVTGPRKPGTIGIPLPGIEMSVCALDDQARALGPGETGELRIRGPNVTRGYWKRPDDTAAAFIDGWFLTGDIGHMDEDGFFFITDRKKDLIISGGFNVYPQMIEQAIYQHPSVEEVLVIGIPDEYRGEVAKAFVKMRPTAAPLAIDELQKFLKDKVGRHEIPVALEIRASLPRTAVGKLSKLELRQEGSAHNRSD